MTALCIDGITHDWGAKRALDGVGFSVDAGQFCALLGPNGAGKSTLFGIMTGLFAPASGAVSVAGHDMRRTSGRALARMGAVFQQQTLDLDLTVWRNMMYFAGLHGMSRREGATAAERALDRLHMRERSGERVRNLNGGHRRRLEIARALMHRPDVLLLDEPTVGLDAQSRESIVTHVHRLAREDGLAVLWATHLTDEVAVGDRLVVLHSGQVVEDGFAETTGPALTHRFLALTGQGQSMGVAV